MTRPALIAGNWKMHGNRQTARQLAADIAVRARNLQPECGILLCPPFVHLPDVLEAVRNEPIEVGAQNVCDQEDGAYTGEVSVSMLADLGCSRVIIGHSERRHVYGESDALIASKFALLQAYAQEHAAAPRPILCIGETLEERESNRTMEVLRRQLELVEQHPQAFPDAVIAYEPVWAIGTGRAATPEMAQETHAEIRTHLQNLLGATAEQVLLLYGGSVKPDNAADLMAMPDIDGGLIGGASLQADTFMAICENVRK